MHSLGRLLHAACLAIAVIPWGACSGANPGPDGGTTSGSGGTTGSTTGGTLTWTTSYVPGGTDSAGHLMEGTEARALVAFGGSLYAGIGYWEDTSSGDANLPGAQVLRLDSPGGGWQVDLQIDPVIPSGPYTGWRKEYAVAGLAALTLTTDSAGAPLSPPAQFLAATTWGRPPGLRFWTRPLSAPVWTETIIPEPDAGAGRNILTSQPAAFP